MSTSSETPGTEDMLAAFDRYCLEHEIKDGEYAAAFAAWLHLETGWDGKLEKLGDKRYRLTCEGGA